uniref:Uncharacterized protein n=1 Tax=Anguilla anguilla TaxID=7936 RepID=A0A0E9S137_ANGAN
MYITAISLCAHIQLHLNLLRIARGDSKLWVHN